VATVDANSIEREPVLDRLFSPQLSAMERQERLLDASTRAKKTS
jgi:hypothetical protein